MFLATLFHLQGFSIFCFLLHYFIYSHLPSFIFILRKVISKYIQVPQYVQNLFFFVLAYPAHSSKAAYKQEIWNSFKGESLMVNSSCCVQPTDLVSRVSGFTPQCHGFHSHQINALLCGQLAEQASCPQGLIDTIGQ